MRPKICWSDLRGARVGVWGLGVEGIANLARLPRWVSSRYWSMTTRRPRRRRPAGVRHRRQRPGRADSLRRGGQVSRHQPLSTRPGRAEERGIPVAGGLGLWLQEADRDRVVCITGTKGKSSTTAIAGHLLTRLGYSCLTGGNIGRPPWDPVLDGPLRLLGHRDIQLPGHGSALLAAGGRRHLAAPRSPGLARRRGGVLPRQAVGLLSARGGPDHRQRGQRPAARAESLLGPRVAGCTRPTTRMPLDGAAGPARHA